LPRILFLWIDAGCFFILSEPVYNVKYDYHILQEESMQSAISSTEVVRNFSELLNNIKYRGDRYTVIRGGKPAASLVPVEQISSGAILADLRKIVQAFPHLDRSDTSFASDIIVAASSQPAMPEALSWE
jgi:antitoxin (DNA-binding transcriptional repressor) of toxin-antitoxin stability system